MVGLFAVSKNIYISLWPDTVLLLFLSVFWFMCSVNCVLYKHILKLSVVLPEPVYGEPSIVTNLVAVPLEFHWAERMSAD